MGTERLGSAVPAAFSRAYRDLAGFYFHKMRTILHGWALSLALGIVAGLYLRGLVISYSFYWESTFIHSPEVVETVFRILFAPALFLFQMPQPGIAASGVDMPGAEWIHILALSLIGYVVLPRLWMFFSTKRTADSILRKGALDLDDDYYRDILFTLQAGTATEQIVVYGFSVDSEGMARLRRGIERQIDVSLSNSRITTVEWGETNCDLPANGTGLTVVFNGVQTPELDVHGDFLRRCAEVEDPLFVIVDVSRLEDERYQKRRGAWSSFFETLQLRLNHKFITAAVMDE
jgi:hypothetical protein